VRAQENGNARAEKLTATRRKRMASKAVSAMTETALYLTLGKLFLYMYC
jgi:hypothetical protein